MVTFDPSQDTIRVHFIAKWAIGLEENWIRENKEWEMYLRAEES